MEPTIEILKFIEAICIALGILAGGVAVVIKVVKSINDNHDRFQKYDNYDVRITNLDKKIDELDRKNEQKFNDAHTYAHQELESIKKEMSGTMEEYQTTIDAKLQQISSELCMLSYCTLANLDGLKQLNCNGKVTEAREKMEKHLNKQAHGVDDE